MSVAACPTCHEHVTVPRDASARAIVRCPWCHAERPLGEFLAQVPPPLIVVGSDPMPAEAAAAEGAGEHAASEFDLSRFEFTADAAAPPMVEWRAASRPVPRRRPNTAWEITKVVAGALLAVPVAQFILWWCVPYTWKRDLLGIGPAVSRVAPWAVPAKFHPLPVRELPREDADHADRLVTRRAASAEAEPAPAPPPAADAPPPADAPSAADADAPSAADADAAPHEPPPVPGPASAPAPAQSYTSSDVRNGLERVLQASVAWDASPDRSVEHRQELTDELYAALAHLGAALAFLRPHQPDVQDHATATRNLLAALGRQPQKLAVLGNRAAQWLEQRAQPYEGLFLFGTVKKIQPEGQLFVTELELAALQRRTIRVYSRHDPRGLYAPGDLLLMLAALVEGRRDALPGYAGPDGLITLGSFPVRLQR